MIRLDTDPIFVSVILLLLAGCAPANPPPKIATKNTPASRRDFAAAFAQLKEGMTANQVEALLGKPDDIQTQTDPDGISSAGTREIWGYGTDHHLGLATLGSIAIDETGRVQYLRGTSGADELVSELGESRLRQLLRLLDRADQPFISGDTFDPRYTVAAVNALQPLGEKIGVALMKEYLKVGSVEKWDHEGLILVMRALFEVPPAFPATERAAAGQDYMAVVHPGYFRPPMLGAPDWDPGNLVQFPLFPLVIVNDVPLVPIGGYLLAGHAESADEHLENLDRAARWRKHQLAPTNDPMGTFATLMARLPPSQQRDARLQAMIARQIMRLIDTAYRAPGSDQDDDERFMPEEIVASFSHRIPKVRALNLRWDFTASCYVRGDGTSLGEPIRPIYRRTIFQPHFADDSGYKLTVIVQRSSSKRVFVTTQLEVPEGPAPEFELHFIRIDPPEMELVNESFKPERTLATTTGESSSTFASYGMLLAANESIRVEIAHGKELFVSPGVQP